MNKTVLRRNFLKGAALTASATALAAPAVAQSSPKIRWRMVTSFPETLPNLYGSASAFTEYVTKATDGNFEIQLFGPGEIVAGNQALDAVSDGTIEVAHTPGNYYIGKDAGFAFGNGIPFGLNARQHDAWWHLGGGQDLFNEMLSGYNAYAMACGNSGAQMGGFFRKEINGLEDIQGLKFRVSGLAGRILGELGVVAQQIPVTDVYSALERGTLDAVEFSGPADDEKLGFIKVAKYYYAPSFWEGSSQCCVIFGKDKWEELPESYKAVATTAAQYGHNYMTWAYDSTNGPALRRMVAAGAEVRPLPDSIMKASLKVANGLYDQLSGESPAFKKMYDSMVAFRSDVLPWWQIGEYAYDSFMVRTRGKA